MNYQMNASLSTLILSIASSSTMSMGLATNPDSQKIEKNLPMAKFNIDLLIMLQEKTKNNLDDQESQFLDSIINDLQMKYVQIKNKK